MTLVEQTEDQLLAKYDQMHTALKAVDRLWREDAALGFAEEMKINSPVGVVWAKVKSALEQ